MKIFPIKVDGLAKSYGRKGVRVLDDVSFELEGGKVLGLLGPNGAGKTTLIKIILGMVKPDHGRVWLFGKEGVSRDAKKRIGFLPEESYLYSFLSIRETLQLAGKIYKVPSLSVVDEMLETIGLSGNADKRIGDCSKGMRRRVALGQALVHDPELLILDEPTSGYDPIGMREVKDLIGRLKGEGKTLLICSHQLAEVQDLCDGIVMLHHGKVLSQGSLKNLLEEKHQYLIPENLLNEKLQSDLEERGWDRKSSQRPIEDLESFFIRQVEKWDSSR